MYIYYIYKYIYIYIYNIYIYYIYLIYIYICIYCNSLVIYPSQARRTGYGRYGGRRTRIFSNLVGSSVKMEKKNIFFKLIFR